ncbi:MAG: diacylglyceryl transferase, partial [Gammaproteobacteria bacterium]|nr:diacylglyceryl transferase [Gammaproteobacteria bacterium]
MAFLFPVTEHPHLLHAIFEAAAIAAGAFYYRILWRRTYNAQSPVHGDNFAVLLGCILGAALGNKLVFWAGAPHLLPLYWNKPEIWFGGQSMVGGLLGGLAGVECAKKWAGVRRSTG